MVPHAADAERATRVRGALESLGMRVVPARRGLAETRWGSLWTFPEKPSHGASAVTQFA